MSIPVPELHKVLFHSFYEVFIPLLSNYSLHIQHASMAEYYIAQAEAT